MPNLRTNHANNVLEVVDASDINALAADTNANGSRRVSQWLTVDGIYIREGVNGAQFRCTGYNCYVMKNAGGSAGQTMNAAQRDAYFAGLRPNSLTRVWAFAPIGGTYTWAQVLAELDAIVASAKAHGQRLIFGLTGMGAAANDAYGGKDAAWFTAHTWRTAVSGSTSLQAWAIAVATRYANEPTVAIYDLINEPSDTSAAFTTDLVLYMTEMQGYVKAASPNALCYAGVQYAAAVGGTAQYKQIFDVLDFAAAHPYDNSGFFAAQSSTASYAITYGKPLLIDEYGAWAKFVYGAGSDTDKDTNGLPATNFRAQELLVRSFLESAFAIPNVFGALIWSWMDTDASWYTGAGQYEPVKQSPVVRTISTIQINEPGRLPSNLFSTLTNWIDGVSSLRYAPGTQVGGPNSGTTTVNLIYDRTSQNFRQSTQANAPFAAQDLIVNQRPSYQFNGAQWFTTGAAVGAGTHSVFAVISPTTLPTSGNFQYLVAPSTSSNSMAVRITSGGVVQLINYGSGTATIIGTGTTVMAAGGGKLYFLEVRWDASGGGWRIRVNGNADANGTTTATLASDVMNVGAGPAGVSGFNGHLFELMKFSSSVGGSDQNRLYAYYTRRYGMFG